MAHLNDHYFKLKAAYLFPEIASRVKTFRDKNPKAKIISLGIGDVVLPLPPSVIKAFHQAVDEMGKQNSFRGYGPEQGYPFLIEAIIENDYKPRGVSLKPNELFISDGAKCDAGNIQEIFSIQNKVGVVDPVYPVYVDTNIMVGREIVSLGATSENHFIPHPPRERLDLVYLCSPNNPTGTALSFEDLEKWVAYAHKNESILLFDAAYEAFITDKSLPHSIYEIKGAKEVAIEFRSFSKTAGFTGTRCAYTVVPQELTALDVHGKKMSLNPLWLRRQTTKFNGVSYPVQKAAAACFCAEGKREVEERIHYYMNNASIIKKGLEDCGMEVYGGVNAPYLWVKTPKGIDSWTFFDKLLNEAHVVTTPGAGFGPSGEGYIRLSAFGFVEEVKEAVERIKGHPWKKSFESR